MEIITSFRMKGKKQQISQSNKNSGNPDITLTSGKVENTLNEI